MSGVRRGEIYYIEKSYTQNGSEQADGRPAIIVSNDKCNKASSVVEVVYLTTQPKTDLPTHVEIRSARKPSTALCEQITSVYEDRIGSYIGKCTEREMETLDIALGISLGIDLVPNDELEPEPEVAQCGDAMKEALIAAEVEKKLESGQVVSREVLIKAEAERIKAEAERDVYKSLYEKLLEKAMSD